MRVSAVVYLFKNKIYAIILPSLENSTGFVCLVAYGLGLSWYLWYLNLIFDYYFKHIVYIL